MIIPFLDEERSYITAEEPLQIEEPYLEYMIEFGQRNGSFCLYQGVAVSAFIDGYNTTLIMGGMIAMTGNDVKFLHLETIQELARIAQDKAKRAVARMNLLESELNEIKVALRLPDRTGLALTTGDRKDMDEEQRMLGHDTSTGTVTTTSEEA